MTPSPLRKVGSRHLRKLDARNCLEHEYVVIRTRRTTVGNAPSPGVRGQPWASVLRGPSTFLRQGLLLSWTFTSWLASSRDPLYLPPIPNSWDYKQVRHMWLFMWRFYSGPNAYEASASLTEPSPSPQFHRLSQTILSPLLFGTRDGT